MTCPIQRIQRLQEHLNPSIIVEKNQFTIVQIEVDLYPSNKNDGKNKRNLSFIRPHNYDQIVQAIPGPLQDENKYPNGLTQVFNEYMISFHNGSTHEKIVEWQLEYGKNGHSSNILIPSFKMERYFDKEKGEWLNPANVVVLEVVVGHPSDAARIARLHVRKQPNFQTFEYGSVISTVDNDHWKKQREQFVQGFLPKASLEKIFPVSLDRAKYCSTRLLEVSNSCTNPVDMNAFLLTETNAQLMLALFGLDKKYEGEWNDKLRASMTGKEPVQNAQLYVRQMIKQMKKTDTSAPSAISGCPVKGPLSDLLKHADIDEMDQFGNGFIFAFAGHDTTGHSLSFLALELAKHPEYQKRLQNEIDQLYEMVKSCGRENLVYEDLKHLPFFTRCFMETLRLWPAVPNGTFRQFQRNDVIVVGDEQVHVDAGLYALIPNWGRHRDPNLWGPDVNEFNPDRDFTGDEIWNGSAFAAYNPASERFSPFTYQPRDCIGKNFAMMESRLIMANLLKKYSFELIEEYDYDKLSGVNYGTMGPQDLSKPNIVKLCPGFVPKYSRPVGLPLNIVPR